MTELLRPAKFVQQIVEYLLKERLKIGHFLDQTRQVERGWDNFQDDNQMIVNQVTIQVVYHGLLVEEWTIQHQSKGSDATLMKINAYLSIEQQLSSLIKDVQKSGYDTEELTHTLLLNGSPGRRSDWLKPQELKVFQVQVPNGDHLVTVSVAYLPRIVVLMMARPQKGRTRFLSDDLSDQVQKPQVNSGRKHSFEFAKFQTTKQTHTDSQTSSSSNMLNKSHIVSMFSKKDDVEIISSPEDAERLIHEDLNDDFEIQMIFVDLDLKTIINDQKKSLQKNSLQLAKLVDYMFNY